MGSQIDSNKKKATAAPRSLAGSFAGWLAAAAAAPAALAAAGGSLASWFPGRLGTETRVIGLHASPWASRLRVSFETKKHIFVKNTKKGPFVG